MRLRRSSTASSQTAVSGYFPGIPYMNLGIRVWVMGELPWGWFLRLGPEEWSMFLGESGRNPGMSVWAGCHLGEFADGGVHQLLELALGERVYDPLGALVVLVVKEVVDDV